MRRFTQVLAVVAVAAMMLGVSSALIAKGGNRNVTNWSILNGTTWIVPKANLAAVSFDSSTQVISKTKDQTVYQITGYRDGYFWGPAAAKVGNGPIVCKSLVGSVTPQGQVMLFFTQTLGNGQTTLLQGFGQMIRKGGEWTMQNQTGTSSMAHWAYMVQSKPGDATWNSLPGVGVSVDTFLSNCPAGPQPAK
jgi:hypothetical protein